LLCLFTGRRSGSAQKQEMIFKILCLFSVSYKFDHYLNVELIMEITQLSKEDVEQLKN
jgi:hypothetical protein